MPSCVFRKLKNYDTKVKKDVTVTYHTFPSDELIRLKWVTEVRAERCEYDWMPLKRSTICSAHFEDQDKYTTPKGYVRLKKICSACGFIGYGSTSGRRYGSRNNGLPLKLSTPISPPWG